jgi:hypothetical protein
LSRNVVFEEIVLLGSPPGGELIGAKIKRSLRVWITVGLSVLADVRDMCDAFGEITEEVKR